MISFLSLSTQSKEWNTDICAPQNMKVEGFEIISFQIKWTLDSILLKLIRNPLFPFLKSALNLALEYVLLLTLLIRSPQFVYIIVHWRQ